MNATAPSSLLPTLAEIEQIASFVFATRCVAVASLSMFAWETVLTIQEEIHYVWRSNSILLRMAYAMNKYGSVMCLVFSLCFDVIARLKSATDKSCHILFYLISSLFMMVDTTGNILTIFRVVQLWGGSKWILRQIVIAAIPVTGCNIAFMYLFINQVKDNISLLPGLSCAATSLEHIFLVISWGIQLAFDIYAIILVIFNSIYTPRPLEQSVFKLLRRDGMIIITIIGVLRILFIILASISFSYPLYTAALAAIQPVISVINSRLILQVNQNHPMHGDNFGDLVELRTTSGHSYFTMRSPTQLQSDPRSLFNSKSLEVNTAVSTVIS